MELSEFKKLLKRRDVGEATRQFAALPFSEQVSLVSQVRESADEWIERAAHNPWNREAIERLVQAGVVKKPTADEYALGLLVYTNQQFREHGNLAEALRARPDLREDDIWRLFRIGGSHDLNLAGQSRVEDGDWRWAWAFKELAGTGELNRRRLLEESLEALARGFTKHQAGWFSRFHEYLEPTLDERAELALRYVQLLGSDNGPTVSFALSALAELGKAGRLPADELLESTTKTIYAATKQVAKGTLLLLELLLRERGNLRQRVVLVAAAGLENPSPDVQSLALAFIEKYGDRHDASLVTELDARRDAMAPSIRQRVQEVFGELDRAASPAAAIPHSPTVHAIPELPDALSEAMSRAENLDPHWRQLAGIEPVLDAIRRGTLDFGGPSFTGMEVPRLDPEQRLKPIDDLDEMLATCARLLERNVAGDEPELLLDALSRLGLQQPADLDIKIAPLKKRLAKTSFRQLNLDWTPLGHLLSLLHVWVGGESRGALSPQVGGGHGGQVLASRVRSVAGRLKLGEALPLLATPTHRGGWIDPRTLVSRVKARDQLAPLDQPDMIQALLRLAPDSRAQALAEADGLAGEFGAVLRFALGSDREAIGATANLWIAAAQARAPLADHPAITAAFPDSAAFASRATAFAWEPVPWAHRNANLPGSKLRNKEFTALRVVRKPDLPDQIEACFLGAACQSYRTSDRGPVVLDEPALAFFASVWPGYQAPLFARGVVAIGEDNAEGKVDVNAHYLDALFDPDVPLDEPAQLLLAIALTAANAKVQGMASDALIAVIDDGRVNPDSLAVTFTEVLRSGFAKPSRWSKGLADVSRVSDLHRHVVATIIERLFTSSIAPSIANVHLLLELLHENVTALNRAVTDANCRAYLSAQTGSSRLAKLARCLLQRQPADAPSRHAAILTHVLLRRLERAERWEKRCR